MSTVGVRRPWPARAARRLDLCSRLKSKADAKRTNSASRQRRLDFAGKAVVQNFLAADLDNPGEATIGGHLDLPEGFVRDDLFLNIELGEQLVWIDNAFQAVDENGDFEFTVPDLPSTTFPGRRPL